jgi:glutamate-ammonia-ligase adenylyltransferase
MSESNSASRTEIFFARLAENHPLQLVEDIRAIPGCAAVIDSSDYVTQQSLLHPGVVLDLQQQGLLQRDYQPGEMRRLLQAQLEDVADESRLSMQLRLFRRQQMLRIIWRDISRLAPLNTTLEDLSELADVCVDEALQRLYAWATPRSGVPRDAEGKVQHMIVIGMGKLGARELNLSSDIDLIFLYPEKGQTDGERPLDNEQFFTRLARQLIKAIGENTAQGFVFRVDTRLRPFGDAGPLVIPLSFLEDYLHSQAREWERYAMVKARVISGDAMARQEVWQLVRPFVYRRYLDFGAIESIRDMKKLIVNELQHRGMDHNIKLGMGGIREIEFIGQAFQLIRGGRDSDLQVRPIQQVLKLLAEKDMLPQHEVDDLLSAYEFLRLTENRLQAWKDEQTHILPTDADGRERLARSMQFDSWDEFHDRLQLHRNKVQGYFDLLFAAPQAEVEQKHPMTQLWQGGQTPDEAARLLLQAGFGDAEQSYSALLEFQNSSACRFLGERGRRRLDELMPMLLEAVAGSPQPDSLLLRMLEFIESIARRTAYLALLVENPMVLSQLIRLMRESVWIAEQIVRHPILLDELIDPRRLYSPLKKEALQHELDILMGLLDADDQEQRMERLRQFVQANTLRVAAADVSEVIPVEVVSDYLTEIAEVATANVYRSSFDYLRQRHGMPQSIAGEQSGFAVIGYGKLGGYELGYSSDLDLVFVHDSQTAIAMTDGDKAVANDVFYARLGQRMIHLFTARTPSGVLYEIDMRLRPNGNSGLLVSSLKAFEQYQLGEAWTWEHQALVRARPVAGDPITIAEFEAVRRRVLSQRRDAVALQREVRDMREKMRASLDQSDAANLDIKQGLGGIADIEFMVQYAVLRWACDYPRLLEWTDNARLLEVLASEALITEQDANSLLKAYRAYRASYHHRSLQKMRGLVAREEFAEATATVTAMWQTLMVDAVQ